MSLPSTPRTERSARPEANNAGPVHGGSGSRADSANTSPEAEVEAGTDGESEVMTPGRRIRYLLAQFDDSDSSDGGGDGSSKEKKKESRKDATGRERSRSPVDLAAVRARLFAGSRDANQATKQKGETMGTGEKIQRETQAWEEDDDDQDLFRPRGRMAARMMGSEGEKSHEQSVRSPPRRKGTTAAALVRKQRLPFVEASDDDSTPNANGNNKSNAHNTNASDSEDGLYATPVPRCHRDVGTAAQAPPQQCQQSAVPDDGSLYGAPVHRRTAPPPNATADAGASAATDSDSENSTAPVRRPQWRRWQQDTGSHVGAETTADHLSSPLFVSPNADSPGLKSAARRRAVLPGSHGSDSSRHGDSGGNDSASENDSGLPAAPYDRLKALVKQKRQEREAREREEQEKREQQRQNQRSSGQVDFDDDVDDIEDVEAGAANSRRRRRQAGSQQPRDQPVRRASKKAQEEMHRETQRMSRSLQLAPQAVTKKKFTVSSFLARMQGEDIGASAGGDQGAMADGGNPNSSSSPAASDGDGEGQAGRGHTPPTSPPAIDLDGQDKKGHARETELDRTARIQTPTFDPPQLQTEPEASKANLHPQSNPTSTVTTMPTTLPSAAEQRRPIPKTSRPPARSVRVRLSKADVAAHNAMHTTDSVSDADDDGLDVVTDPGQVRKLAVFENLSARARAHDSSGTGGPGTLSQSLPMRVLRSLAQVSSSPPPVVDAAEVAEADTRQATGHEHGYSKNKRPPPLTQMELDASLLSRARAQAVAERAERLAELKAKGILVEEEAGERTKIEEEVEDLVEKARNEAAEIARKERGNGKKGAEGELDSEDEEQDEEYFDGTDEETDEEEDEDEDESEDEEGEDDEDGNQDQESEEDASGNTGDAPTEKAQLDAGASSEELPDTSTTGDKPRDDSFLADGLENATPTLPETDHQEIKPSILTASRRRRVIDEDEDDNEDDAPETQPAPKVPDLGSHKAPEPFLNLSQAFSATIGSQSETSLGGSADESPPRPSAAGFGMDLGVGLSANDSQLQLVPDSQGLQLGVESGDKGADSNPSNLFESHPQRAGIEPPAVLSSLTQSDLQTDMGSQPPPTQDAGFTYAAFDEAKRFNPTPPTPALPIEEGKDQDSNSPVVRRGIRRGLKNAGHAEVSDKKTKKTKHADPFDRNKSHAREIVEEAAEESDNEYAGLGGVSDDSEGDEDEYDRDMIDDNSGEAVDEKQLAALNADHARSRDEAQIHRLLRDIESGGLRRKRGRGGMADELALSDSDEEEVDRRVAARRRARQLDMATRRQALVAADERVGAIAEDPKKKAFLRTIEDREEDGDVDILAYEHASLSQSFGQGQSQPQSLEKDEPDRSTSNSYSQSREPPFSASTDSNLKRKRPLDDAAASALNTISNPHSTKQARRGKPLGALGDDTDTKPRTLMQVRESLSFLIGGDEGGTEGDGAKDVDGGDNVDEDGDTVAESESEMEHDDQFDPPGQRAAANEGTDLDNHSDRNANADKAFDNDSDDDDPLSAPTTTAKPTLARLPSPTFDIFNPSSNTSDSRTTEAPSITTKSKPRVTDRLTLHRQASTTAAKTATGAGAAGMAFYRTDGPGSSAAVLGPRRMAGRGLRLFGTGSLAASASMSTTSASFSSTSSSQQPSSSSTHGSTNSTATTATSFRQATSTSAATASVTATATTAPSKRGAAVNSYAAARERDMEARRRRMGAATAAAGKSEQEKGESGVGMKRGLGLAGLFGSGEDGWRE